MKIMRHLFVLIVAISCCTLFTESVEAQQVNYPWNPNADDYPMIGTSDLLPLLGLFGSEHSPSPIEVDSLTLEEYLAWIQDQIQSIPQPDCDPCAGLTEVAYDGHVYPVVPIECECWFAENLFTDQFSNGDPIPHPDDVDYEAGEPWQVHVNNNPVDGAFYGRLYSEAARSDERGICPVGWRVPIEQDAQAIGHFNGSLNDYSLESFAAPLNPHTGLPIWDEIVPANTFGFNLLPISAFATNSSALSQFEADHMWIGGRYGRFGWQTESGSFHNGINTYFDVSLNSVARQVRCVKLQGEDIGCTDPAYLNYTPTASYDDGSCQTLIVMGCMDSEANNFDPQANMNAGNCVYQDQPPACNGQEFVYYNNQQYSSIEIAGKCWLGQDLQTALFANGDSIPSEFWTLGESALLDTSEQGHRYHLEAIQDPRGLCPAGWHPSSFEDWDDLATHFAGYTWLYQHVLDPGEGTLAESVWADNLSGPSFDNINGFSGLNFQPNMPSGSTPHGLWYVQPQKFIRFFMSYSSRHLPIPPETADALFAIRCVKD